MSAHSRNLQITGGGCDIIPGRISAPTVRISGLEQLQKASAPNALHNSSTVHKQDHLHPNTREAVLDYMMAWIFGRNNPEARILWLYGPGSAGKTALLQTITERCIERQILLASFLFLHSDPTRNSYTPLVATIAYQLAATIPEIKPTLVRILECEPLILDRPFATQLQHLIVEPLKHLVDFGFFDDPNNCTRLLILIDGLEACGDPHIVLSAIADVLRAEAIPLVFLISSQPEQCLMLAFNSSPVAGLWRSVVVDNQFEAHESIRLHFHNAFQEIKTTHPRRHLIPTAWPMSSDIDKLVEKASGLFIYASMVAMYVSAAVDHPPRRLEVVMGLRPTRCDFPFFHLDDLYMHILRSCADPAAVFDILGLVNSGIVQVVDHIEILLDLAPGDAERILAPLASLVSLESVVNPKIGVSQRHIEVYHVSFGDFLGDATRSGPFHLSPLAVDEKIVSRCLRKLMNRSLTTGYQLSGQDLPWLESTLRATLKRIPLTEAVESALNEFSLQRFWASWSPGLGPRGVVNRARLAFVLYFLENLSPEYSKYFAQKIYRSNYSTIYASHLASFENIVKLEIPKYFEDAGLTSLLVFMDMEEEFPEPPVSREACLRILLALTPESIKVDDDSLCLATAEGRDLLAYHYFYCFAGQRRSAEWHVDNTHWAQTALRVLQFLCDYSPYDKIRYQQRRSKRCSLRGRALGRPSRHFRPSISSPRKRREEKHRYGITLFGPGSEDDRVLAPQLRPEESLGAAQHICDVGLTYLPTLLAYSSNSPELVDFIRRKAKHIAFLPKRTREVIRAMHAYLIWVEQQDVDMVIG